MAFANQASTITGNTTLACPKGRIVFGTGCTTFLFFQKIQPALSPSFPFCRKLVRINRLRGNRQTGLAVAF